MKRSIILPGLVTVFVALSPGVALADNPHSTPDNPNRTGQPMQDAESQPSEPAGFTTTAFQNVASQHYAGSVLNPNNGNTAKAVSQYDVAAFQVSNNHGHTK
jgi:hypothetical protein